MKTKKKRVRRVTRKASALFVAVVLKDDDGYNSGRQDGDWASFVGFDKAQEIGRAIEAKKKWESKGYGPYQIFVGTLTENVTLPTNYKVTKLQAVKQ